MDRRWTVRVTSVSSAGLGSRSWEEVYAVQSLAIEALTEERDTLRAALEVAKEAMDERRGYADAWEWKYGETWDYEDKSVQKVLDDGAA